MTTTPNTEIESEPTIPVAWPMRRNKMHALISDAADETRAACGVHCAFRAEAFSAQEAPYVRRSVEAIQFIRDIDACGRCKRHAVEARGQ